jgi:EamA-like transporter family
MSSQVISTAGRALTPGAVALMLMLCISWGFNQIAVKLVLPDVPPMLQALTRSIGALPVLLVIGWLRGIRFFERDGTLRPGLIAGIIFGIEFVLIYRGLLLTSACVRWCFSTPLRSSSRSAPICSSASGCARRNGPASA